jgi:hypothetical protein
VCVHDIVGFMLVGLTCFAGGLGVLDVRGGGGGGVLRWGWGGWFEE